MAPTLIGVRKGIARICLHGREQGFRLRNSKLCKIPSFGGNYSTLTFFTLTSVSSFFIFYGSWRCKLGAALHSHMSSRSLVLFCLICSLSLNHVPSDPLRHKRCGGPAPVEWWCSLDPRQAHQDQHPREHMFHSPGSCPISRIPCIPFVVMPGVAPAARAPAPQPCPPDGAAPTNSHHKQHPVQWPASIPKVCTYIYVKQ